jgi:hypothetical protein
MNMVKAEDQDVKEDKLCERCDGVADSANYIGTRYCDDQFHFDLETSQRL